MRLASKLKFGGGLAFSLFVSTVLVIDSMHVSAVVPYIAERVNLTYTGSQMTTGNIQDVPTISQDGRYVAFATDSSDIVANDTNNAPDIFVRDRKLGTTVRADLTSTGAQISTGAGGYKMSANGRYVVFPSASSTVVPGDTNSVSDLFLRDLKSNTTEMVSLTSTGGLPNSGTSFYDISADGRYIVFTSDASNIVSGDTNAVQDIFVRDRKLGTTTLLSKSSSGALANNSSVRPTISCDGSYVAFTSTATNLVVGDTNGVQDVFLVDRVANNEISNLTINGNGNVNAPNGMGNIDISCNGERLVFASNASNLVPDDSNNATDIFAYSMIDGTFQRVNLDSSGNETVWPTNPNTGVLGLSSNTIDFSGRYVAFWANTSTLVAGDTNNTSDIFLRDLVDGTTQIISKRSIATQTTQSSFYPSISLDGREVVFASGDTGYVSGDTNANEDIFVSKTGI